MPNTRRGKILHNETQSGVHVLRYLGWVNYALAPSLRQYFESLLDNSAGGLVFDLSAVVAIDSTNLGLLARMAVRFRARHAAVPVLIAVKRDLREFLRSIGFHEIFQIVEDATNSEDGKAIGIEEASRGNLLHTMLDAHRALSSINDDNRERFEEVVVWLEDEDEKRLVC